VNWERYNDKLDIWSIGCIMGELIVLHPLFPGNDLTDQLNKIFGIIGTPNQETLDEICTSGLYK
jgi:serine/threonine protein kinase